MKAKDKNRKEENDLDSSSSLPSLEEDEGALVRKPKQDDEKKKKSMSKKKSTEKSDSKSKGAKVNDKAVNSTFCLFSIPVKICLY